MGRNTSVTPSQKLGRALHASACALQTLVAFCGGARHIRTMAWRDDAGVVNVNGGTRQMRRRHIVFLGMFALSAACDRAPCDPRSADRGGGTVTPDSQVRGKIQECEPPASWDVRLPPGNYRLDAEADWSRVGMELLGDGVVWTRTGIDAGDPGSCAFSEGGFSVTTESQLKVRVSTRMFCEGAGGPLCTIYDYTFQIQTLD